MLKVIFNILWQRFFYIIPVLVNVAFVTLLERKILGLRQARKGPNKVYLIGIFQPFRDAIKLFLKEIISPYKTNLNLFLVSPILALFLIIIIWRSLVFSQNVTLIKYSLIFFLFILRFNIYPLFLRGWSSNRKYAIIGRIRGISQTISYEISLALIILTFAISVKAFSLTRISLINNIIFSWCLYLPLLVLWLISCVAETNRTPFDFSEGESELVSGFNVEYASVGFALLFIAEYGIILFLRALTRVLRITYGINSLFSLILQIRLVFFWIWLRATFPRFRYDKLMDIGWKINLPLRLTFLVFFSSLREY